MFAGTTMLLAVAAEAAAEAAQSGALPPNRLACRSSIRTTSCRSFSGSR